MKMKHKNTYANIELKVTNQKKKKKKTSWAWWCTPLIPIPALRRQRQADF
jgi:hypothetical protein